MWNVMYRTSRGPDMECEEFIPLDFEDLDDREVESDDIQKAAALVWYGFLLGSGDRVVVIGEPELVWREPVDLSVTKPPKPPDQPAAE